MALRPPSLNARCISKMVSLFSALRAASGDPPGFPLRLSPARPPVGKSCTLGWRRHRYSWAFPNSAQSTAHRVCSIAVHRSPHGTGHRSALRALIFALRKVADGRDWVELAVADSGIGLTAEQRRNYSGLVQGRIWIVVRLGSGTTGEPAPREQPRAPCAIRPPRPEASVASIDRIAFDHHQPGPDCRISNWQGSVSGHRR
jgi:hypothetical protein